MSRCRQPNVFKSSRSGMPAVRRAVSGTLLPLTAKAKKVALIGPMADNPRDQLGAWTYGDPKYAITLRRALSEKLGDNLLYSPGCGLLSGEDEVTLSKVNFGGAVAVSSIAAVPDDAKSIAVGVATARQADIAILALGESANWMEGEAASRAYLGFTGANHSHFGSNASPATRP
jgi:beta-glucosidase